MMSRFNDHLEEINPKITGSTQIALTWIKRCK